MCSPSLAGSCVMIEESWLVGECQLVWQAKWEVECYKNPPKSNLGIVGFFASDIKCSLIFSFPNTTQNILYPYCNVINVNTGCVI